MSALRFVYFADPMCSWCYGFSPVITSIAERFEGRMDVQLVMGGLRAGNTAAMRSQDKEYIKEAWTRVAAATGQPDGRDADRCERMFANRRGAAQRRNALTISESRVGQELHSAAEVHAGYIPNKRRVV